jgi:hypothetical protein
MRALQLLGLALAALTEQIEAAGSSRVTATAAATAAAALDE